MRTVIALKASALAAAAAVLGFAAAAATPPETAITYLPSDQVSAAFAKGVPLVEEGNYKVHASRRDAAGQAELHEKDTDIIYMLDGSATLITGGEVLDGKTTALEEIRGTSIGGGESRRLGKGDVMIVPAGTPHWFKEVSGPVLYYVVKVRQEGGSR